jgi:hypothetical protein
MTEIVAPLPTRTNVVLRWFCRGGLALSAFLFLFGESRLFESTVRKLAGIEFARYYNFSILVSALSSLLIFLLARILNFRPEDCGPTKPDEETPKRVVARWLIWLQIFLSILILARSVNGLDSPLEFDESSLVSQIAGRDLFYIMNPFNPKQIWGNINQRIATATSRFSLNTFGISEINLRLPAVGFTALILILLFCFCRTMISPFTSLLLYSHLLANQNVTWYSHSAKGYISAMFFTCALMFLVIRQSGTKPLSRKVARVWFVLLFSGAILSHTFAGLFSGLLFISLLVWLNVRHREMSWIQVEDLKSLVLWSLVFAPVIGYVFIQHLKLMSGLNNLFSSEELVVLPGLLEFFGMSRDWWLRALFLCILALAVFRKKDAREKSILSFPTVFILITCVFFAAVLWSLKVSFLAARYLLPFLIPIVVVLGEEVSALSNRRARSVLSLALIALFAIAPALNSAELYQWRISRDLPFRDFMREVRERTGPQAVNCYTVSGDPVESAWAESLYLPSENKLNDVCSSRYHLYFQRSPYTGELFPEKDPERTRLKFLYTDESKYYVLYQAFPEGRLGRTPISNPSHG